MQIFSIKKLQPRGALLAALILLQACASTGGRNLASSDGGSSGEELDFDTQLYADILSQDTGKKRLKYNMDFRFATDIQEDYLQKKARAAFQTAIAKTLSVTDPEKGLAASFKENMIASLVDEFVKTIYVFKIINGTIQVDLTFLPENDTASNFDPELSSNQLVRWSASDSLLEKFDALESPDDIRALTPFVNHPVIQEQLSQGRQAYLGGVITLWIKLVDMRFNPANPIPNPAKNAVKGNVRFRRFFASHPTEAKRLACTSMQIEKLTFASDKKESLSSSEIQYITVDQIKSFNLKQLVPKDESVEFYFGHLLPNNKGRKGLVAATGHQESPLKSGELQAVTRVDTHTRYKHRIGTLVWSLENNEFDASNSILKSSVVSQFTGDESVNPIAAQKDFLSECKSGLIESLDLKRYLPKGAH